eukprot:CAMPEP_0116551318 /NCGR_PEP_ID=MMETSP0397-20121206/5896_1 /TAXON_ID=216820 /ORGANISM="Cyclophora tenuis, Strain ECT3854" /LENGTH=132 /DNA_ID=CAMNT_0004076207 /DNA_START=229 /DNA_END=627 /DNA_ORIENTATION=+
MMAPASVDFHEISRLVEHDAESLPRPSHEKELKVAEYLRQNATTSSPMQCPPRRAGASDPNSIAHSAGEAEYLSRLYNLRTWNMYKLIKETRENDTSQQIPMQPRPYAFLQAETPDDGRPSDQDMVFDLDFE